MDTSWKPDVLRRSVNDAAKDYAIALAVAVGCLLLLPSSYRSVLLNLIGLIILTKLIAAAIIRWKPRERVDIAGKAVLITGCDSGFGHKLAQRLDDLGFHVFASCLFPDGEGAEILRKSGSSRLHVFGLDVTKNDDAQEAVKYVKNELQGNELWAVICNAGIFGEGELHWTKMDNIERTLDVNTFGVIRVAKAFLSELCKSHGRVIIVASIAGRYTIPGMTAYCMSKHAVVSFCDGLRMEMYKWGVNVVSVEPHFYRTAITDKQRNLRVIENVWDGAPEDIKVIYPKDYFTGYVNEVDKFLSTICSRNIDDVVACLEEAVVSKEPRYNYQPGDFLNQLLLAIYFMFPKPIMDCLGLYFRVSFLSRKS